jgi:site-specific DNA recombinase
MAKEGMIGMNVALYVRVSTVRQADNDLSIPDQLHQLREFAKSRGDLVVFEYIEPGASATTDNRPQFQQMIADSQLKPTPFEAVLVHSFSRFFRDSFEFMFYERKLKRNNIVVISITQPISDDPTGNLLRNIITGFDAYSSAENSKHVTRAIQENSRQGYFSGAKAPYGYKSILTEVAGTRGRKRKKLAIDEAESGIVNRVFELYAYGHDSRQVGCKEIAKYLNERGLLYRGRQWRMQEVQKLLSNQTYIGTYLANRYDSKKKELRPASEWISVPVPAIIDPVLFEKVRVKRGARKPSETKPRVLNSPTLLTGLLKCHCGASMTIVTGKSGRYKYYKCTKRQARGNSACSSGNIPVEQLDDLVLHQLKEKIFTKDHFSQMIEGVLKGLKARGKNHGVRLKEIEREIKNLDSRLDALYEAIETRTLPLDARTQKRAQDYKARREALFIEQARARRENAAPSTSHLTAQHIEVVREFLTKKLSSSDSPFTKSYLHLLVEEITINKNELTVRGSNSALVNVLSTGQLLNSDSVPTFDPAWCA